MSSESQRHTEPASGEPAEKSQIPRRRLLLSTGGIILLGLSTAASVGHAGIGAATVRAARGRTTAGGVRASVAPTVGPSATPPASPAPSAADAAPTTSAPQPRVAMAPQYYIDDAGPVAIALTLDDGPDPHYTPQVLAILESYGIQATFNMIGEQIDDNLSLVREVAAAGHTITNHTWDHADMRKYSAAQVISEIDQCNDALADAGQTPTIFRAPYGYWTPAVFQACAARELTPLGWSVDPQDWDTDHVSTQDIVDNVLQTTNAHDIILEHDGGGDRSNTVAALRIFIPELLDRGFVFAAI